MKVQIGYFLEKQHFIYFIGLKLVYNDQKMGEREMDL